MLQVLHNRKLWLNNVSHKLRDFLEHILLQIVKSKNPTFMSKGYIHLYSLPPRAGIHGNWLCKLCTNTVG